MQPETVTSLEENNLILSVNAHHERRVEKRASVLPSHFRKLSMTLSMTTELAWTFFNFKTIIRKERGRKEALTDDYRFTVYCTAISSYDT